MGVLGTIITGIITAILYDFIKSLFKNNPGSPEKTGYPENYTRNTKLMFYIGLAIGCLALLFIDPSAPDASLIVVAVIGILMAVDGFAVAVDFQQDSLDKDADKEA